MLKLLAKREHGFTFVEVLIALAVLSIIAAGFLMALAASSNSTSISDERTSAESLARTEMEYVKNSVYTPIAGQTGEGYWQYELPNTHPSWDSSHNLPAGYETYVVRVRAVPLHYTDDGIQLVTITIIHHDKTVYVLEGYKINTAGY